MTERTREATVHAVDDVERDTPPWLGGLGSSSEATAWPTELPLREAILRILWILRLLRLSVLQTLPIATLCAVGLPSFETCLSSDVMVEYLTTSWRCGDMEYTPSPPSHLGSFKELCSLASSMSVPDLGLGLTVLLQESTLSL